jgi:GNAT superfamily N-acetyltransferase
MAASSAVSIAIHHVTADDERGIADAATISTAYWREVLGDDEPPTSPAEVRNYLHAGRDDVETMLLVVRDGDQPVGMSHIDVRTGHGNEHMTWVDDLYVLPSHRRRGIGRMLLDENVELTRRAGRTLMLFGYDAKSADGAAFAKAIGGGIGHTERQNRVRVDALDRAMLESWLQPAAGYSLVQFDDRCPDDLLDAVVATQNVMNDAPRTELLGDFLHTTQQWRDSEREMQENGVTFWYSGVRHDASGAIAGYSSMTIRADKPWLISQEDTAVHPDHRGKAIGRWLKATNALRVLDERPDARWIETWNDGSNRWMLAINDDMGFRPVAEWVEVELELELT